MAEGMPNGAPIGASTPPVQLNVPGGSPAPQQPTFPPAQPQAPGPFNPEQLPADLRAQYDTWQRDRQEWDQKSKSWEGERENHKRMEQQFQALDKQLKDYAKVAETWQQWIPIINGINKPGVIEQAIALSRGEPLRPTQGEPTPQQGQALLQRFLQGVGDDDVVTGAMVNQALSQLQQQVKQETLRDAEARWTQYAQQVAQHMMQQLLSVNNEYYGMADQLLNLKLQKLYGLQPKEGALYDEQRIIQEAQRLNNRDLNLAYTLLYGDEHTRQAVQQTQQQLTEANKKELEEAYQRGRKEGQLQQHNQQNPLISPSNSTVSVPQFKATKNNGYAAPEAALREALTGLGLRG